ncbi:hypothetical protein FEDK69T_22920 [Flavobacterium enshiense DK69]|uniref:Glycine zipper domain-containing protein n=1 Tax=Flavobacterium enshiense DK69 TaxID=1107311 RepID=V6S7C6_9FLAO|nr:DUF1269 domain-containing protein [Flavobacterium enshiense]ESU22309.1 hypothetical protein FEDK69T_22920 [Flavobacterium enshiense DK69]KGO97313.1 hypothetical protein Q767_01555 [Flavobacterium enshiense DK69]
MSLYNQIYQGETFTEQDYFEAVRYVLGPEYSSLSENQLENELLGRVGQMSESEAEGFWSSLGNVARNIGSGVLRGVSAIAPIAGTAVGTYFGAPQIGAALGGVVGNLAGSASSALSNTNTQRPRPQYPQQGRPQAQARPGNGQLGQTWQNTTRYLANAGRAVLPAVNQYVQNNPVPLEPQVQQDVNRVQGFYSQLGSIINNPQFQAGQAQQSLGTASPNAPIENVSFAELVESLNYLTESILYEYYNNGLIPTEDYHVDDYGQFVASYTPQRVDRIQSILATI